jgi:epidermal growth factor receptor substrate 15
MYLIKATMSGQLSFIPTSLPPGLYDQASGTGIVSHGTGGSGINTGSFTPTRMTQQYTGPGALQAQATGQKRAPPVLPSRKTSVPVPAPSTFSNMASAFSTGQLAWDVTPAEKATADKFFDTLDTLKLDYIEGDVAVPFMLQSNLPEDILAQVWSVYAIYIWFHDTCSLIYAGTWRTLTTMAGSPVMVSRWPCILFKVN